jgi:hypothetical protein
VLSAQCSVLSAQCSVLTHIPGPVPVLSAPFSSSSLFQPRNGRVVGKREEKELEDHGGRRGRSGITILGLYSTRFLIDRVRVLLMNEFLNETSASTRAIKIRVLLSPFMSIPICNLTYFLPSADYKVVAKGLGITFLPTPPKDLIKISY